MAGRRTVVVCFISPRVAQRVWRKMYYSTGEPEMKPYYSNGPPVAPGSTEDSEGTNAWG